ncbi:radical SAM protein [Psychrobacter sp. TAE2020]|uniref:radical SAM protein n=1 Tax=Psychrobacter sp. TAE2020 TaxID=2846762 RepID=UPI001C108150|nr:radical SAM protein [Psychrobacter sp. TAE2020]MBU5616156.1 radical SAM protein [Psychrobacter sp. TAE2020]
MYLEIESSEGNRYLFDGLTNDIYSLEPDFQIIDGSNREDLGLPDIKRSVTPDSQTLLKVNNSAKTLIIELTEQCNLRCTYCVFDDSYPQERSHSSTKINHCLAKNQINNFFERAREDAYIIFYGGEPLLEFKEIVELTSYAKSLFKDRVKFSFTTNGMALTQDKLDFLIENDFLITVSLDGYQKNHDSKRITINGHPSWGKIMDNLQFLKDYDPIFYSSKLIVNSVINSIDDLDEINKEVNSNTLLEGIDIRFSFPLQDSIIETKKYNEFNTNNYEEVKNIFLESAFSENVLYKDRLLPLVQRIAFRKLGEKAQEGKKKCVPFANRTYIRSNGEMQFCERISSFNIVQKSDEIIEASHSIQDEFYTHKQDSCSKCFAYNFCELCPASFYYEGSFHNKHEDICNNFREEFLLSLKLYTDLSEKNVTFAKV